MAISVNTQHATRYSVIETPSNFTSRKVNNKSTNPFMVKLNSCNYFETF